jgi:hypothetical protein
LRPIILKEVLEASEQWKVYNEARLNWSLVNHDGVSVEIPKAWPLRFLSGYGTRSIRGRHAPRRLLQVFRHHDIMEEARRVQDLPIDGSEAQPRIQ